MKNTASFKLLSAILAAIMLLTAVAGCSNGASSVTSSPTTSVPSEEIPVQADVPSLKTVTEHTTQELSQYYAINSDFAGIFEIPELGLREVTVTAPDNNYYLRRDINRDYRYLGILYYDFRNLKNGEFGANNIIYGHNVGKSKYSDDMFGKLVKYREGDTYLTANTFKFTAVNGYTYYFELFAGYAAPGVAEAGDKYFYINTEFDENKSFHYTDMRRYEQYSGFINTIKSRSDFKTDLEVNFYDKILTLVTCVYDYDDCRYVLHAKLLHTDEVSELLSVHPEYSAPGEVIGNPAPY